MQITRLSDDFAVSPQLQPGDVAAARAEGFRSIMCNRPDGEEPDQPAWAEIAQAASGAGLDARQVAIGQGITVEDRQNAFAAAYSELPKPILAFCRTGNRSTLLFETLQADDN